jgi:hypothetical protein
MKRRFATPRNALLGLTLLLAAPLAGCLDTPSALDIKDEMERALPGARFSPTEHVHLGRFTMALIHGLVRMAGDDDPDHGLEMARAIHAVDVTTYRVESLPPLEGIALPARFADQLTAHGWSVVVRTAEPTERTWILSHLEAGDSLTGLCVVSLEPKELTIVRIDGRLDRLFALALAEHPRKLAAIGK